METIRRIIPFAALISLLAFFISINFQFHLFSIVPKGVSKFMTLFGFGLISFSAFSILLAKYKWSIKLSIFVFLNVLYFIFHPIKYKTNDLPQYLKDYDETFNKITQIIDNDSIFSIWNPFYGMNVASTIYKTDYESSRKINYDNLEKELRKLNISLIRIDKNKYIFTYAFSQFGGFGLIKSKIDKIEQPETFFGGEIKRFEKINDEWYYFTYD